MKKILLDHVKESLALKQSFFNLEMDHLLAQADDMAERLKRGCRVLVCGNGGSAADAQHLAAEFVNRFMMERPPLPALALTTDSSILTAIGNDYGFEQVFQKQVQALGQPGDMLVGISTSGNSPNVVLALKAAREKGVTTVGMTGRGGGEMAALCDYLLDVSDRRTPLVQEIHITVGHLLCQLTDHFLFENVLALQPYLEGKAPE